MPLTSGADRQNASLTAVTKSRQPLAASQRPFSGSAIGLVPTTGFSRALAAGDKLIGFADKTTDLEDVVAVDGGNSADINRGLQTVVLPVTGVVQADVAKRRMVYALDDGIFGFVPYGAAGTGYTPVGPVIGVWGTNLAFVQATPDHFLPPGIGVGGAVFCADATYNATVSDLDKILVMANTAARTINLPPAADCAGRFVTVVKSSAAAFAITVDPSGAELVEGAATLATGTARDRLTIWSDGTQWLRVA
jgi:hypothetical protein